ncbi:perlucin-like protein [Mytilus trossulus]|uniref:perlucin-like protein n=1 Tax=Mytilus trossulus TaxID=6551 RepID=UPI003004AC30
MSWENAKVECQTVEGYLVKIENSEENTWIKSIVKGDMWIGLNDRQTDGDWVWDSDNSTLTYNDWGHNQPDYKSENCCDMWIGLNDRQTDGDWVWDSDNSTLTYNDWGRHNQPDNKI